MNPSNTKKLMDQLKQAQQLYKQWETLEGTVKKSLSNEQCHAILNNMATIRVCSDLITHYSNHMSSKKQSELLDRLERSSQLLKSTLENNLRGTA